MQNLYPSSKWEEAELGLSDGLLRAYAHVPKAISTFSSSSSRHGAPASSGHKVNTGQQLHPVRESTSSRWSVCPAGCRRPRTQVSNTRPAGPNPARRVASVAPDSFKDTRSPFLKEIEEKYPMLLFLRFRIKWIYVVILETCSYVQYFYTQKNNNQMQRVI